MLVQFPTISYLFSSLQKFCNSEISIIFSVFSVIFISNYIQGHRSLALDYLNNIVLTMLPRQWLLMSFGSNDKEMTRHFSRPKTCKLHYT